MAEIIAGGTPKTSVLEYWNPKEVPWLSSGEVHKKYITYTDDKISKKGLDHSSAKIIKENSVLIALAGQGKTRGTVAINRIPLSTNQSIAAMIFNDNIVPEFIFSNLDNRYNELRRISSGDGSRGGLNKLLIGNIIIPYTDKLEQDKIGQFFSLLDHLITLHQRKILLYKYFFTIVWEQRKLSKYATFLSGNGLRWDDIDDTGVQECILYGNLYTDYGMMTDTIKYRTNSIPQNPVYSKEGDVLIPASDTTPTGLARATSLEKSGVLLGGDINIVRPNKDINGSCLSLALNANKDQMIRLIKGTTVRHIHNSDIQNIDITLPNYKIEQFKIASYFKVIDNIITLHRCKCIIYRKNMVNAWEQRKLNEICNYKSSSLTVADRTEQGKFPLYDANGQIGMVDSFYMQEDYITVIKDGAGVGRIRRLPKNTAFIGTMGALTSKNSELNFLYYLLEKKDLSKQYTGSTIPHIYFKDYGRNDVLVSDIKEQQKIGLYFDQLDHLITLHQWKCIVCTKIKVNTWIQCKFIKIGVKLQKCILLSIILLFKRRKVSCVFYVNILLRFIKVIELEVELVFVIIDGTIIVMFYLKIRCLYLNIFIFKINK